MASGTLNHVNFGMALLMKFDQGRAQLYDIATKQHVEPQQSYSICSPNTVLLVIGFLLLALGLLFLVVTVVVLHLPLRSSYASTLQHSS